MAETITVRHPGISVPGGVLTLGHSYRYVEFNYPLSSRKVLDVKVKLREVREDDWGITLKLEVLEVYYGEGTQPGHVFGASSRHDAAEIWHLSQWSAAPEGLDLIKKYAGRPEQLTLFLVELAERGRKKVSLEELEQVCGDEDFSVREAIPFLEANLVLQYDFTRRFDICKIVEERDWRGRWPVPHETAALEARMWDEPDWRIFQEKVATRIAQVLVLKDELAETRLWLRSQNTNTAKDDELAGLLFEAEFWQKEVETCLADLDDAMQKENPDPFQARQILWLHRKLRETFTPKLTSLIRALTSL